MNHHSWHVICKQSNTHCYKDLYESCMTFTRISDYPFAEFQFYTVNTTSDIDMDGLIHVVKR